MLLRRVIAHVRRQARTAIWIDLAIVVFGVFIGIQVSNWNESRHEAQRAYRKIVRGLTPSVVSTQVWAHCHAMPVYDEQYLFDCDAPMSEAHAQAVLDAYMADPRLLSELRFWITNLEVTQTLFALSQEAARELIGRLPHESSR